MAKLVKTEMPFAVFSMEADRDYLLARLINFLGAGFHSRAGFFAQQACEKYMKALMVQNQSHYVETHSLTELAEHCASFDTYFTEKETQRILEQFDLFDQVGRYGGAAKFDPLSRGTSVGGHSVTAAPGVQIAGASVWTSNFLNDLDGFVFRVRSFLDFTRIGFDDGLKSILEKNRKSALVGTWEGRQPLRAVLTKRNRYFPP